jgi:hypothetical protein
MIRWVKYVVLRHEEIRDRADSMKRFIKAGQVRNLPGGPVLQLIIP